MSGTRSRQALLVLDMISELDFPQWREVLRAAEQIAPVIERLQQRARAAGVPVIYVNDTRGDWESDQTAFIKRCRAADARGRAVVEVICPQPGDDFIFKPKHSGFHATPLETLLQMKCVEELILTGTTSHQCVLFTAIDAYVRDYRIVVPADCIGAPDAAQTKRALFILKESVRARTPKSTGIRFGANH